jgi:hypothetical protein
MKGLWMHGPRMLLVLFAAAALAAAAPKSMPVPGTLNYLEGQVSMNGQEVSSQSIGTAVLRPGNVMDTGQGKAELLLTPGVFLRLGDNTQVRMISPGLADTRVELLRGSAMLEVAELFKENNLAVQIDGFTTRVEKNGLYDFHTGPATVNVLDGKATVSEGDGHVSLKKGHGVVLAGDRPLRAQDFRKDVVESDPLYAWSKLRSEYAAEANVNTAQTILVGGGWYGPGWYWDPYWSFYSFLPGSGILYSPWGWGFYSPNWVWQAPRYYHYPVRPGYGFRPGVRAVAPAPHVMASPRMGGGFRGGFSGGFHGGGGRGR